MKGFGSKPTEIAWHYTIGRWAEQILVDKYLKVEQVRPGDKGLDEYPCVWFSKSEDYEPTALKFIVDKKGCVSGVARTQSNKKKSTVVCFASVLTQAGFTLSLT